MGFGRTSRVGLVLLALVAARVQAQEPPKAGQGGKYALLVGVRQYRPNTLRNLQFTEADVNKLAEVLERSGYRHKDITILTQTLGATDAGLLPTVENIRAQLGIPARSGLPFRRGLKLGPLDEDDSLLVAFAGHGVQFEASGDSFFCPMDADLGTESSLIRLADVSKALDGCKAGFKLLLVDACRNNPQIQAGRNGTRPVVDLPSLSRPFLKPKPGGTMAMFSCSPGEIAFEDDNPDVLHGIFFHHVIRALNGEPGRDDRPADADGDGKVDALELARYAERNVASHAAERFRVEQTVEVANRTRGSIAIVERRGPRPKLDIPDRPPAVAGRPQPRTDEKTLTNSISMKLNLIPPGEFLMGAADGDTAADDDEKPRHRVRITRPFYLGVTEVTQGQYRAVTGENLSGFRGSDDLPVEQVSWLKAVKFCDALSNKEGLTPFYRIESTIEGTNVSVPNWKGTGYRLPTEAEWEYACRGGPGGTGVYNFGDDADQLSRYAWYSDNSNRTTHSVGQKAPNVFGLFDMHGNVWEWCWDYYAAFDSKAVVDPIGPDGTAVVNPIGRADGSARVFRGGSWNSDNFGIRSADRRRYAPQIQDSILGFRVARVRSGLQ